MSAPPPAQDNSPQAPALQSPQSPTELFLAFTIVALQGFGGVLAIIQRELVDKRRWLTRHQFVEDWAVAQILPGPNVVNLSIMLGDRYFGVRGAVAALTGMLALPLCVVIALVVLYGNFAHHPMMQGALRGMGAAAAGLIGAAAIKMIGGLKLKTLGAGVTACLIAITFVAVGLLRLPLIWAVVGFGGPACVWAWWRLRKQASAGGQP